MDSHGSLVELVPISRGFETDLVSGSAALDGSYTGHWVRVGSLVRALCDDNTLV